MVAPDVELVEVLEEERPLRGLQRFGVDVRRLELEADLSLDVSDRLFVLLLLLFVRSWRCRIRQYFRHDYNNFFKIWL